MRIEEYREGPALYVGDLIIYGNTRFLSGGRTVNLTEIWAIQLSQVAELRCVACNIFLEDC